MATYFLPWGDINTASSRLRVYVIQPFIKDAYLGVPEEYKKGDTLIIQKTPNYTELVKAKAQGARVIYDIDDFYWDKEEYKKMIEKADLVTVDTDEKVKMLKELGIKAVAIPDALDWDGTRKEVYGEGVIGWTGYGNNAHYLNPILDKIPYKIRLITTPDWTREVAKEHSAKVQSRPWSLDMVDKYLAECDLGLYYLPEGEFEQAKGMHKLLKNWAIGIPTYTSPMPDYVKAMEEAGVGEKYIVKNVEDWKNIQMVPFDEKCREYAIKFEAKAIAKLWISVIGDLRKGSGD